MSKDIVERFSDRLGYTEKERELFQESGHRIRQVRRMSEAAPRFSILAEVIASRHCNSGHTKGQTLLMDIDGNFITKHCPKKMCVYLISQLTIPVALINERINEGLDPNHFHFMRQVSCLDVGVECMGYGQVMVAVSVVPRDPLPTTV
ncbi:hypothetical protein D3OALGA1CA_5730 [Olavius algarvensis associated proteobacterium Delta 3]|nr:hypothetical protein D3OALGB2SA_2445 [Olavius algarvensis associated proteobacterium Delta 3]CAB5170949.1 hypothetical protein D3OALGA1CA_5730 [Olavius algarvensis associated proteobacterium Delta 3]